MPDKEAQAAAIARQIFLRTFSSGRPTGGAASHLARVMHDELFPAGTALYAPGEASDELFFIVRGRVQESVNGARPWVFEAGTVIGLLDALQDRPHERAAEALSEVHALALRADDYFDVLEDHFELTRSTLINMAEALHALRLSLAPTGGFTDPDGPEIFGPRSARGPRSRLAPSLSPRSQRAAEERPMNLVERTLALRDALALWSTSIQALTTMAEQATEVRLGQGDVLVREGDPSPTIHVVVRGLVEVSRAGPTIRASFGPRSLLGGYASLAHEEEPYTARAFAPSVLLRLEKEDLFDLLELHFDLVRSVFKNMAFERELALVERAARGGGEGEADELAVISARSTSSGRTKYPLC